MYLLVSGSLLILKAASRRKSELKFSDIYMCTCFYHYHDVLNLSVVNRNDVKDVVPLEGSVNVFS